MIDVTKKYKLANGRTVTSLEYKPKTPDGKRSSHPIKGLVDFPDINGKKKKKQFVMWTAKGTYYVGKTSNFDLVEVK